MTEGYLCGPGPGCVCTPECEMPCWQRVGISEERCCSGCAPLPSLEDMAGELSDKELERRGAAAIEKEAGRWPLHVVSMRGRGGILVRGFSSRLEPAFGAAVLDLDGNVRSVVARKRTEEAR